MADQVTTFGEQPSFPPGTVVKNRGRLWRVDAHQAGVLIATAIDTGKPALQTASVGEIIERATFDPEWALDNPDLTLPDVGHPLVRRLIEEVKQQAYSPRRDVPPERLYRRTAERLYRRTAERLHGRTIPPERLYRRTAERLHCRPACVVTPNSIRGRLAMRWRGDVRSLRPSGAELNVPNSRLTTSPAMSWATSLQRSPFCG